jgi:hypothetical protein
MAAIPPKSQTKTSPSRRGHRAALARRPSKQLESAMNGTGSNKLHINLNFDASEYLALQEMARKYGTDVGSLLRIAGVALLEAERTGRFTIGTMRNKGDIDLRLVKTN